jgi:hypothetical protein
MIIKSNIDDWQAKKLTGTELPQKIGVPLSEYDYQYDTGQLHC